MNGVTCLKKSTQIRSNYQKCYKNKMRHQSFSMTSAKRTLSFPSCVVSIVTSGKVFSTTTKDGLIMMVFSLMSKTKCSEENKICLLWCSTKMSLMHGTICNITISAIKLTLTVLEISCLEQNKHYCQIIRNTLICWWLSSSKLKTLLICLKY